MIWDVSIAANKGGYFNSPHGRREKNDLTRLGYRSYSSPGSDHLIARIPSKQIYLMTVATSVKPAC